MLFLCLRRALFQSLLSLTMGLLLVVGVCSQQAAEAQITTLNTAPSASTSSRPLPPRPVLPRPAALSSERRLQAANYLLGSGDVIAVSVLRHPEMSVEQATIAANGKVNLPVVGEIVAAGRTLEQVEQRVTQALRVRLQQPEVTVVLRQARPRQIFILGAVAHPGIYDVRPGWRVTEALAVAGGLTARVGVAIGTISRENQKAIALNVPRLLGDSSGPENRVLRPGDTLRFAERIVSIPISVTGQVQKPGTLEVPVGSSVLNALAAAGGTSGRAALSKATLRRANGDIIPVDLYRATVGGDARNALKVQAGDLLTIPEADARVTILGAVARPGFFDIPDGKTLRVAEVMALAGGPNARAALTRATVTHANGRVVPIDLYKTLVLGDQTGNIELAPNDVIMIPESRGITVLGAVGRPGTFNLEEGSEPRVSDVLALAGGLSIAPESARISIARRTSSGKSNTSSVNAVTLLDLKDLNQNERVRDGDLITVSSARLQTVFVSGEVKNPGAFELKEGDGVLELIARAGGPTTLAALKNVSVIERDGTAQNVDALAAALPDGQRLNLPLQEGDYVVVAQNPARVLVMQAVLKPGYVPIPENGVLTLGEALIAAGGPKDRAKTREVAVLRQTPAGIEQRIVSLERVYNGQLAVNTTLQAGDVVYVPDGKQTGSTLDNVARLAGSVGILGTLFR